jgi:hypothetical protein
MSRSILHRAASALALAALCLAFGAGRAAGQSTTNGAVGGTVKDPNGAVVVGATVTVTSRETNREGAATTDDEGRFRVVELQRHGLRRVHPPLGRRRSRPRHDG